MDGRIYCRISAAVSGDVASGCCVEIRHQNNRFDYSAEIPAPECFKKASKIYKRYNIAAGLRHSNYNIYLEKMLFTA